MGLRLLLLLLLGIFTVVFMDEGKTCEGSSDG